jgi:hypothetical protein
MRKHLLVAMLKVHWRTLPAGFVALLLGGCISARPGVVPARLQAAVGQPFVETEFAKPTVLEKARLPDRDGQRRYQFTWKNGCSYVVLVSGVTGIVTGYHYTSEEALCTSIGRTALGS